MLLWLGAGALATTGLESVIDGRAVAVIAQSSGDIGGMVIAAIALVALGLAGMALWRADLSTVLSRSDTNESGVESVGTSDPSSEPGPAAPDPATTTEDTDEPKPEELTDREKVVHILDDNEGRMKQARIVDETGWSKSKVSMLLSEMEDEEEISKLRVGRENIISLSGNEPEAAGSPFDDE